MEFKSFDEIKSLRKVEMTITQKIHGTNAQILIENDEFHAGDKPLHGSVLIDDKWYQIRAGSRTRWIYPGDDNYGFAQYVDANKESIIRTLGVGTYYGEWAGPGINSGEGLSEKTFVLFDWWKFPEERPLPPQMKIIPILYRGPFELNKIKETMDDLKANGSKLVPGYTHPEGVVVRVLGQRIKSVFDPEETRWTKSSGQKAPKVAGPDVSHLLQPIRLEKLLSRDERLIVGYPETLPEICKMYVEDLIKEEQIVGDEGQMKAVKKSLSGPLFGFIKATFKEKNVRR